ncbi:hypothetical protein [Schlesneria sp. T3-172]|uniref:hypothetical protein n=1 Tax=Schlesneria sphaerica TaxID=3373610 RepID=UPI0037CA5B6F
MRARAGVLLLSLLVLGTWAEGAEETLPLIKPEVARQHVGKRVAVVFEVKGAKHSEKRKIAYLDSTDNFRDEANLGIAISERGINDLKQKRQVELPAEYYRGKSIRVQGEVVLEEDRVYIKVDDADQIDLAK